MGFNSAFKGLNYFCKYSVFSGRKTTDIRTQIGQLEKKFK